MSNGEPWKVTRVSYRARANHLGPVSEVVHSHSLLDLAPFTGEGRMTSFLRSNEDICFWGNPE